MKDRDQQQYLDPTRPAYENQKDMGRPYGESRPVGSNTFDGDSGELVKERD